MNQSIPVLMDIGDALRLDLAWLREKWGVSTVRWLGAAHDPLAGMLLESGATETSSGYTFIGRKVSGDLGMLAKENWRPQAGYFDVF